MAGGWEAFLVASTALHLGFQLAVTCLVYPALAASQPEVWERTHEAHSRRIVPVVAVVYAAVLLSCVGALLSRPTPATWVVAMASAGVFAITALLAAPLHGQLGHGYDRKRVARLLRIDRGRSVGAFIALAVALLTALS